MICSRTTTLTAVLALALACAAASPAAAGKDRPDFQIKFATLAPEGTTWMKTMHAIDDEVRERTDNRLGFKFYPGGVQGDEKDVLRKIRMGQLHGGGFTGNGLGSIISEARVLELPFMFRNLEELDFVRSQTNDYFYGLSKERGYLNLGWADVGFIYLFSKNPIRTPDDLRAAKIWVWEGDPLAEMFLKAFGISPIPLAATDVLTSLQTGIIDAVYNSTLGCIALQWFTRVSYMTDVPVTHSIGAALVSEKALQKVAPADVAILLEVARPRLRQLTLETRVQNREAVGELEKEGIEVVEVPADVRAEFYATGRGAWSDGVGSIYPRELLDRVEGLLAEYRAAHPDSSGAATAGDAAKSAPAGTSGGAP